jgi:hypothetical protein
VSRDRKASCFYQYATSNLPADQRKLSSCGRRHAEAGESSTFQSYVQPCQAGIAQLV